jgi:hypothetical protein
LLLGHLKNEPPDRRKAVEHFYDALALYRSTGDLNGELEALAGLAIVADADGRPEEAAAFRKEAEALKDLSTSESTGA